MQLREAKTVLDTYLWGSGFIDIMVLSQAEPVSVEDKLVDYHKPHVINPEY